MVAYYETEKSQILIPRHIYVDFRDNFGNFSSCFSNPNGTNQHTAQQVKSDLWLGHVEESQQNEMKQSKFQKELQWIDQIYYDSQIYEGDQQDPDRNQDHEDYGEEDEQIDSSTPQEDIFA